MDFSKLPIYIFQHIPTVFLLTAKTRQQICRWNDIHGFLHWLFGSMLDPFRIFSFGHTRFRNWVFSENAPAFDLKKITWCLFSLAESYSDSLEYSEKQHETTVFQFEVFRLCLMYCDLFERHVKCQFKYTDRLHTTSYSKSNKMIVIHLKSSTDVAGWNISSPINPLNKCFVPQMISVHCTPPSLKKNWVTPILGIFNTSPAVSFQCFQGCNLAKCNNISPT